MVITSDRGLCGAYNNTIIRMAEREIEDLIKAGRRYSLVVVGTKALNYFRFRQYEVAAAFSGVTDQPTYDQAKEIAAIPKTERVGFLGRATYDFSGTTQGYGEQYLKVQTQEPSRENRRVAVRRVTPLIQQDAANAPR